MSEHDNSNSGALFRNDRRTEETHPQYKGNGQHTCPSCGHVTEFWIAAWLNEAKKVGKYFKMRFSDKDAAPAGRPNSQPAEEPDDVPF